MKSVGNTCSLMCGMVIGAAAGGIWGMVSGCRHTRLSRCVCRKAAAARELMHSARDILCR